MSRCRLLGCFFAAGLSLTPSLRGAADAGKGKAAFEQCGVCHLTDSDQKKIGPGLKGLYKKSKMANGKKPTDETVLAVINEGGNGMPAYKSILNDAEKQDLLAYLKTL